MKLFRRTEPKTTHPHSAALGHLKNAHAALMKENASEAQSHIGRAFQAVSASLPKQAPAPPPIGVPSPSAAPPSLAPPTSPKQRFQQLTQRGQAS